MEITFWQELEKLYEKENIVVEFQAEKPILTSVIDKLEKEIGGNYSFENPLGIGGSGIVLQLKDKHLGKDRAIKIPRPIKTDILDTVKNEMGYLNDLRHSNIISLYDLGEIEIDNYPHKYPYFVMDYIRDAHDIKKRIINMCKASTNSDDIFAITSWLIDKIVYIADAIEFLHDKDIIHFDIKPSNILMDMNDKPILGDLGFAKKKDNSTDETTVGFTMFYAHPGLRTEYTHMSSKNRVRKKLTPRDFQKIWDVYAFGKTILELLGYINRNFHNTAAFDYNFTYLHLMACRMLDARNISNDELGIIEEELRNKGEHICSYKETWLNIAPTDFQGLKYREISTALEDFKKLSQGSQYLATIPELNDYFPDRIHCSDGLSAPCSKRVRSIIDHPVFRRLKYVPQLGLNDTIYPTATHNRYEHSIGVFRNCCLYIKSLFNDPYNQLTHKKMLPKDR